MASQCGDRGTDAAALIFPPRPCRFAAFCFDIQSEAAMMRRNTGRYLKAQRSSTAACALFLLAALLFSVRGGQALETTSIGAAYSTIDDGVSQLKNWSLKRYAGLRFVYEVEIQISELQSEKVERCRKAQAGRQATASIAIQ